MEESTVEAEVLWAPTPEMVERSQLTRYIRWLAENRDLHFEDYHALWRWSVTEIEEFWGTLWEYFGVIASRDPQGALGSEAEEARFEEVLAERVMPGARWFEGARLNYAEHIFRGKAEDEVALSYASELRRADRVALGRAARTGRRREARVSEPSASRPGTASSPTSRTAPRPWSPSSPPPASAPSGRAAHRTSGRAASSTASPRSSRRSCSPSTATATAARTSTGSRSSPTSPRRSGASSASSSSRI